MTNRLVQVTLFLLTVLLASGCGSLNSRLGSGQEGHPYSGVKMDIGVIQCALPAPYAKENRGTSYFISIPFSLLVSALFVIDLPFSFVADTLLLPLDIATPPGPDRFSLPRECSYG